MADAWCCHECCSWKNHRPLQEWWWWWLWWWCLQWMLPMTSVPTLFCFLSETEDCNDDVLLMWEERWNELAYFLIEQLWGNSFSLWGQENMNRRACTKYTHNFQSYPWSCVVNVYTIFVKCYAPWLETNPSEPTLYTTHTNTRTQGWHHFFLLSLYHKKKFIASPPQKGRQWHVCTPSCTCVCAFASMSVCTCLSLSWPLCILHAGVCMCGLWHIKLSWSHHQQCRWKGRSRKCQTVIRYQWCRWGIHLHICTVKWNMRFGVSPRSKNRAE